MTAEIVVMNGEAVAMAADSAVTSTVGGIDKISSTANKVFSLSNYHPIGIMVYGSSSFMGIPWETLIKVYRSNFLPSSGFPTVNEYAKHFISFLRYENFQTHSFAEENYILECISDVLGKMVRSILGQVEHEEANNIGESDLSHIVQATINRAYVFYHSFKSLYVGLEESKAVLHKYDKLIEQSINSAFSGFPPLAKGDRLRVRETLIEAFSRSILDNVLSGVVLAGFGEKELLPTVKAFKVEGIVTLEQKNKSKLEFLKYMEDPDGSSSSNTSAIVIPYAQSEMACRFMEGVDPDYVDTEEEFLDNLCKDFTAKVVSQLAKYDETEKRKIRQRLSRYGKQMTNEFTKNMKEFRQNYFVTPTVEAVGRLSKNELALMAEALVYVTSLKRKVSSDSETVAEPIDVALISKGDGFIWIKRKHYFDPTLNPGYFRKRNKEANDANQKTTENPA